MHLDTAIFPCRNKFLALTFKHEKKAMKVFWSCPILLDFLIYLKIFCTRLSIETKRLLITQPSLLQMSTF